MGASGPSMRESRQALGLGNPWKAGIESSSGCSSLARLSMRAQSFEILRPVQMCAVPPPRRRQASHRPYLHPVDLEENRVRAAGPVEIHKVVIRVFARPLLRRVEIAAPCLRRMCVCSPTVEWSMSFFSAPSSPSSSTDTVHCRTLWRTLKSTFRRWSWVRGLRLRRVHAWPPSCFRRSDA